MPRYETAVSLNDHNSRSANALRSRQPSATSHSMPTSITLRVCEQKRYDTNPVQIEVTPYDSIIDLKQKIAAHFNISDIRQFYLEMYDQRTNIWEKISWRTREPPPLIKDCGFRSDSLLSIGYQKQPTSNNQYLSHSALNSNKNEELAFRLCKTPLDKLYHKVLRINSSSTVEQLRKKTYEQFGLLSTNKAIYIWQRDTWEKYDTDMDDKTLADIRVDSYSFLSVDPDEVNSNSRNPPGLCGLINYGSTCFMNSIFQCLSNIPKFTEEILKLDDTVTSPILSGYIKLIKKIWSGKYKYLTLKAFLQQIEETLPRYTTYHQQDAQEFMDHFLHSIHNELTSKDTLVTNLFYSKIQSNVQCLSCENIETTNESMSFLPLSMRNDHQMNILYIKNDGEQCLVPVQIDFSVKSIGDLINCFLSQSKLKIEKKEIKICRMINNIVDYEYDARIPLSRICEEELIFVKFPKKDIYNEKYVWCEFRDRSTRKFFRPPVPIICPHEECRYTHIEIQIEQLIGHLCSITGATYTHCHVVWLNNYMKEFILNITEVSDKVLERFSGVHIEMDSVWIDIYKEYHRSNNLMINSTLTSLMDDFFREEQLDDAYHCLKCEKHTKAKKKSSLCFPLPYAFTIQLKRFTYDAYSNDKVEKFIQFPIYDLDLSPYVTRDEKTTEENNSSTKYDLVAVSNHIGSLTSGHYITYAKNATDGKWYSFDDSYVEKLNSENDIVTKNAYLLIYIQKNLHNLIVSI